MIHTAVVILHIVGAVGGLIAGGLALFYQNGTRRHRLIGKTYLVMWAIIALTGYGLGWDGRVSVFEIATTFGVVSTIYAYWMVLGGGRSGAAGFKSITLICCRRWRR
jgi:uncharacterized membrane protein